MILVPGAAVRLYLILVKSQESKVKVREYVKVFISPNYTCNVDNGGWKNAAKSAP
jgi:hypothetical protein